MKGLKNYLVLAAIGLFAVAAYGATVAFHIVGAGGPQNDTLVLGFSTDNVRWGSYGTVAAAGSNQGTGTSMTYTVNNVTGADGTKGVVLPAAKGGLMAIVFNNSASILKVYPNGSDTINGASSVTVTNKYMVHYVATADGTWCSSSY